MRVRITEAEAKRCGIVVPKKRKPGATVAKPLAAPVRWSITLTLGAFVVSEANRRDHWAAANRRKKEQCFALEVAVSGIFDNGLWRAVKTAKPPVVVTWVHIGRRMDEHDNLRRAFKGLVDHFSCLFGEDDGSGLIEWRYEQRPGKPGVELRIEHGMEAA